MKKFILFSWLMCCLGLLQAMAQSLGSISGKIVDATASPVMFANIALYSTVDSTIAKIGYSNHLGVFSLPSLSAGEYWISISYVGFKNYQGATFRLVEGQVLEVADINMEENTAELSEVTISDKRSLLEVKPDRVVFNVENSINATGSNSLDLLRKAPNVMIDNRGNIAMMGRNGVVVAINGKTSPLRGADLAAFLQSLQADQIEAVELITDPGASFEADGSAGVINIRLKKDSNKGTNGNLTLGYSQGELPRYNVALSGNHRTKKVNIFGSYGFNRHQNPYEENIDFELLDQFQAQILTGNIDRKAHSFKAGADVALSPKSVLGALVVGRVTHSNWDTETHTGIGQVSERTVARILQASSQMITDRTDLNYNLNYRYENPKGVLLNMDADYAYYRNDRNNSQPNRFLEAGTGNLIAQNDFFTNSPTDINIYTFRVDHERPLGKGKLGLGAKWAHVETFNLFEFFMVDNNQKILDTNLSNQFDYTENVNAAYLTYNGSLGEKFKLSLGLRAEHTRSEGLLTAQVETANQEVKRDYLDFFPSFKLGYSPSESHDFQFSYGRRINRPSYPKLNPFRVQVDALSYLQGNPFLQPEYSNTVRLEHTFKSTLSTTLAYSHTNNLIADIFEMGDNASNNYNTVNIANQKHYSISFGAPFSVTDWWESYSSFTAFHVNNQGTLRNIGVDIQANSVMVDMQNTFTLPADFSIELTGSYSSPTLFNVNEKIGAVWTMDLGVQKSVMKGQGNLTLTVSDLFWTSLWPYTSEFGGIYVDYFRREDTRRVGFSFSYRFGNQKLKAARQRELGSESEKGRIN